jgi:CO dehydrogenase maturation factor
LLNLRYFIKIQATEVDHKKFKGEGVSRVLMKLAISGKGGVGKTTLAAALTLLLAERGHKVLAVDADPDPNLAAALGISAAASQAIIPIAQQKALIEERTGAKVKQYGQMFKLNPQVADIAEQYAYSYRGVALLVLGAIEAGGSGCACPESVLLKALVQDLVLFKNEALIMDMEAGIEHLGRATARGVDQMLVVVEPGQRSLDSARRIVQLSREIGLKQIRLVGNRIAAPADETLIQQAFPELELLSFIPYSDELRLTDRDGCSVLDGINPAVRNCFEEILAKVTNPEPV